ncbi:unnamed protein product [Prunus armeniaca]|uniref:Uncharacterized protein n=1 Tax=Prunus armeniaca TaxID=36596 RepID=A0A6J5WYW9_PRUAR|nr:hypothetical protein GBA52_010282 [Prunus armeniaca]CAB4273112.1 unnamed protein product [Prunus armeniaca]CAB4303628.1 unnamed protein product [Prunus armeniaca]
MEAVACPDHSDKENTIPPFFPRAKLTAPVRENGSSSQRCSSIGLRREPLADITNLLVAPLPTATLSFSSSVSASNSRKRNAIHERNTIQVTSSNSKFLRMGFR